MRKPKQSDEKCDACLEVVPWHDHLYLCELCERRVCGVCFAWRERIDVCKKCVDED